MATIELIREYRKLANSSQSPKRQREYLLQRMEKEIRTRALTAARALGIELT
jgi:hypothetical protein